MSANNAQGLMMQPARTPRTGRSSTRGASRGAHGGGRGGYQNYNNNNYTQLRSRSRSASRRRRSAGTQYPEWTVANRQGVPLRNLATFPHHKPDDQVVGTPLKKHTVPHNTMVTGVRFNDTGSGRGLYTLTIQYPVVTVTADTLTSGLQSLSLTDGSGVVG